MGKLSCGLSIPGVFEKDGRYYKVVRNEWLALSRIDEGTDALYRALWEIAPERPDSIGAMMRMYAIAGMDHLSAATRKDYGKILPRLHHHFGKMRLGSLRPSQIAVWLEKRRQAGRGAVRANREFAVLSAAHKFAMRQGWVEANPCYGVSRNPESPKEGGTTDEAFLKIFNIANESFQDLIAAGFLSGVRQTDIIAWTRSANLHPEGIRYVQSKTGKPHLVRWSDALRFFVRRACERWPDEDRVFLNTDGLPWTQPAINSQFLRLRPKAGVNWCFKDLRAKAQTDSPHSVLGHGAALEAVYRKTLTTRPVR